MPPASLWHEVPLLGGSCQWAGELPQSSGSTGWPRPLTSPGNAARSASPFQPPPDSLAPSPSRSPSSCLSPSPFLSPSLSSSRSPSILPSQPGASPSRHARRPETPHQPRRPSASGAASGGATDGGGRRAQRSGSLQLSTDGALAPPLPSRSATEDGRQQQQAAVPLPPFRCSFVCEAPGPAGPSPAPAAARAPSCSACSAHSGAKVPREAGAPFCPAASCACREACPWHRGFLPQTWELFVRDASWRPYPAGGGPLPAAPAKGYFSYNAAPMAPSESEGTPMEAVDVSRLPRQAGAVYPVVPLLALPLRQRPSSSLVLAWKVLVVAADDPLVAAAAPFLPHLYAAALPVAALWAVRQGLASPLLPCKEDAGSDAVTPGAGAFSCSSNGGSSGRATSSSTNGPLAGVAPWPEEAQRAMQRIRDSHRAWVMLHGSLGARHSAETGPLSARQRLQRRANLALVLPNGDEEEEAAGPLESDTTTPLTCPPAASRADCATSGRGQIAAAAMVQAQGSQGGAASGVQQRSAASPRTWWRPAHARSRTLDSPLPPLAPPLAMVPRRRALTVGSRGSLPAVAAAEELPPALQGSRTLPHEEGRTDKLQAGQAAARSCLSPAEQRCSSDSDSEASESDSSAREEEEGRQRATQVCGRMQQRGRVVGCVGLPRMLTHA